MFHETLETLEFSRLSSLVARETQTARGRTIALRMQPSVDLKTISRTLDQTTEARRFIADQGHLSIGELPDPEEVLGRLRIDGNRLEPQDLTLLMRLMEATDDLRGTFHPHQEAYPALRRLFDRLPDFRRQVSALRRVLLPTGEIDERASPELRRLRQEIQTQRNRIQRHLEGILKRADLEAAFSDEIVTQRNGRYVIPVRNDHRGAVQGVVHAMSSSGATAFVEPLSTIDLNNEMVALHEKEEAEIARILFEISDQLRDHAPALTEAAEVLGEIDFVAARARFADAFDCTAPTLNAAGDFKLEDARHPLLEANLRAEGKSVVPVSFDLSATEPVMVISGPNAGGKTVVLKTAGLLALMAQCGLHLPAKSATCCVFNQIRADIGDHQSLAANLSTFSSHITNLRRIAEELVAPALVLIDEIGTGTDPDEGAALGTALVDFFKSRGTHVIVSTHYNPLKIYADTTEGVFNAAVEFDAETLQPTYRLLVRQAGVSSGIEIARRLKLPEEIVSAATQRLGSREADMSRYLEKLEAEIAYYRDGNTAIEEERAALADRYNRLVREFDHHEKIRQKEFSDALHQLRDEFLSKVQPVLETVIDKVERQKLKREAQRGIERVAAAADEHHQRRPQLQLVPPVPPGVTEAEPHRDTRLKKVKSASELRVGDRVRTELGQEGTVEAINDDKLIVLVGGMRLRTAAPNVQLIVEPVKQVSGSPKPVTLVAATPRKSTDTPIELNLIGLSSEEAIDRTDKFLDNAALNEVGRVRIVHGMGLGILRKAIDAFLDGHPHVSRFYRATPNEGGNGATVVELR